VDEKALTPGFEELDFELSILDRTVLPDQLIEPLLGRRSHALVVDIGSVVGSRRLAIDEDAKSDDRPRRCDATWLRISRGARNSTQAHEVGHAAVVPSANWRRATGDDSNPLRDGVGRYQNIDRHAQQQPWHEAPAGNSRPYRHRLRR
jgi:hypothetical protein